MHNATEILKTAKQKAIGQAKTLARENILMNEVLSKNRALLIENAIAADDRKKMEEKFNARITQHRLRRGDRVDHGDGDDEFAKAHEMHSLIAGRCNTRLYRSYTISHILYSFSTISSTTPLISFIYVTPSPSLRPPSPFPLLVSSPHTFSRSLIFRGDCIKR